jgi:hypothetical protein
VNREPAQPCFECRAVYHWDFQKSKRLKIGEATFWLATDPVSVER